MEKIVLYYNPYTESTRFIANGKVRGRSGRRIDDFIVGKPIESWLSPYVRSYHRWDGLLPELMSGFNDDELSLAFYSVPELFHVMEEQLNAQAQLLQENGYEPDLWTCTYTEYYCPDVVAARLRRFIEDNRLFAPDQRSLNLFDCCRKEVEESKALSVELLRNAYQDIRIAIRAAMDYYVGARENDAGKELWTGAERELYRLFERSGRDL